MSGTISAIANIAALRSATATSFPGSQVYVIGYYNIVDGGEGFFVYSSTDTTSADNSGTIIVDASGRRWYRETHGLPYSPLWFGAKYDGATNDTAAHQSAAAAAAIAGVGLELPAGSTVLGQWNVAAIPSIRGAGSGATKITIAPGTYPFGTGLINFMTPIELSGISLNCVNGDFLNNYPINFTSGVTNAIVTDIVVQGEYYFGMQFNGCTRVRVRNCQIISTNSSSTIGLCVVTVPDAEVSGCALSGTHKSHLIQLNDCSNGRVFSNVLNCANSSGFGISFDACTGCQMWGNECNESGPEAFQLTSCLRCSITNSYASWATYGHDFGSSMESCTLSDISGNSYINSYKAAVGIASDNAASFGNTIRNNHAYNCATRATAAGLAAPSNAVFVIYSTTYPNTQTEFSGNIIWTDSGSTATYGYLELAGGAALAATKVRDATFLGAGIITTLYAINQSASYVWMDQWTFWNPTITNSGGALASLGNVVARYIQEGPKVSFILNIPITTNGSGGGYLEVTLPISASSTTISSLSGREAAISGKGLAGNIGSTMFIYTVDNSYPGANGALIIATGSYQLP